MHADAIAKHYCLVQLAHVTVYICSILDGWLLTMLPAGCRYLILFLKFIASVVPTIEYDYTMAAGL